MHNLILVSHEIQYYAPMHELFHEKCNSSLKVIFTGKSKAKLQYQRSNVMDNSVYSKCEILHLRDLSIIGRYRILQKASNIFVYGWYIRFHVLTILFFGQKTSFFGDSTLSTFKGGYLKKTFLKALYSRCKWILFAGVQSFNYFNYFGLDIEKFISFPHAVSDKFKNKIPQNYDNTNIKILFIGQFTERKGVRQLLEAVSDADFPDNITLIFVGGGNINVESSDKIINIGFVPHEDIMEWYDNVDYLILPSLEDSWGLVVNEAISRGLPVLVSIYCGCYYDLRHVHKLYGFNPRKPKSMLRLLKQISNYDKLVYTNVAQGVNPTALTSFSEQCDKLMALWRD